MSNSTLFLIILLTAIILVVMALLIAKLLSPKSNNFIKGEPYECGIPTSGNSWIQLKVGYYIYAILYLVFDIETVLLFPLASVVKSLKIQGLITMIFFFAILSLSLAYAWKKGVLQWE